MAKKEIIAVPDKLVAISNRFSPDNLQSQNATTNWSKRRFLPYAFTGHGAIMAAAILKCELADRASVQIVKTFVAMRRFLAANAQVFQRLDRLEIWQLETDHKVEPSTMQGKWTNNERQFSHIKILAQFLQFFREN